MTGKFVRTIDTNGFLIQRSLWMTETTTENGDIEFAPYMYTLASDETILNVSKPKMRANASSTAGFVRPRWDGSQWVEGATAEEIAQWELDNPAPVTVTNTDPIDTAIEEGLYND